MPIAPDNDYINGLTYLQRGVPVSFPTYSSDPAAAYAGDTYFTGAYFRTYGVSGWQDLGSYLQLIPANIVGPTNFNVNAYGSGTWGIITGSGALVPSSYAGTSTRVSRADHTHDNAMVAKTGQVGGDTSTNGNTWYGYQSQQLDNANRGGWSISDYLTVFMSASNVGLTIAQNGLSAPKDAFQYQDFNTNITFRITSSGQLVIGTASNTISNSALTIRSFVSTAPAAVLRAATSQTANIQEWQNSSGASVLAINSAGNIALSNVSSHPATPTGGGLLYASAGALVYKGSSGTISQVAPA